MDFMIFYSICAMICLLMLLLANQRAKQQGNTGASMLVWVSLILLPVINVLTASFALMYLVSDNKCKTIPYHLR